MNDSFPLPLCSAVDELNKLLRSHNKAYILASAIPARKVYIQFEGRLKNQSVVWNACIRTIEEFSQSQAVADDPKQFIDIQLQGDIYMLEVGLNVQQIDQATIERTIIMIRNYKRLQPGRHEYGAQSKTRTLSS